MLQEDEQAGNEHHGGKHQLGLPLLEVGIDVAYIFSQSQCGGEFGKLGGLEFEGTEINPRLATIGDCAYKEGENE